jgi:hypothetical protein
VIARLARTLGHAIHHFPGFMVQGIQMPDLTSVYASLHKIMAPYAAELDAKKDDNFELYVDTKHLQKNKKALVLWRGTGQEVVRKLPPYACLLEAGTSSFRIA